MNHGEDTQLQQATKSYRQQLALDNVGSDADVADTNKYPSSQGA
ncbi:MAG: hypothetical protein R3E01_09680 [Pirellulaceae bacterium]